MLQKKLVIAMCAAFALSACGGSDQDDQSRIVLNPPEDLNAGDEDTNGNDDGEENGNGDGEENGNGDGDANGNGDGEVEEENTLVFEMGDSRWGNNGSQATVEYNGDEDVLVITPDFTQVECPQDWDADALCTFTANHTVDGPLDLRGTHFVFELEISQSILDNGGDPGGIVLQAYGQVNSGDYGGYWGCEVNNQDIETTSVTFECTMPEDNDSLNLPEGGNAGQVGLQILRGDNDNDAGGVNNDIEGTITMKSFMIYLDGPPPTDGDDNGSVTIATGDESFTFESDVQGWNNDSTTGSTISHDADAQALVLTPNWGDADEGGNRPKAMVVTQSPMSEASVAMIVTLTQAQVDAGLELQPYIQQNSGTFSQEFGGQVSGLEAGDNVINFTAPALADAQRLGIQLVGNDTAGADPVLIKQVEITVPEMPVEPLPAGDESFNFESDVQGWNNDSTTGSTISHDTEAQALVLTPNWADADEGGNRPKAMVVTQTAMGEASVAMIVTLTQAQADAGLELQPYIQQNSGSFAQEFGAAVTNLEAGDNVINFEAAVLEDAQRLGIQLIGSDAAGTDPVLIKQVEITAAPAPTT